MPTGYPTILALIYTMGMAAFLVVFFVDWIRNFERIRGYWRHAVAVGLILVGLNIMIIAIMPGDWSMLTIVSIASLPVLFVKMVAAVMLGTYYCARIGRPGFLLLPQKSPIDEATSADAPLPTADDAGPRIGSIGPDLPPAVAEALAEPIPQVDVPPLPADDLLSQADNPITETPDDSPPPAWSLRDYIRNILMAAAVSVIYSALLFVLTKPHLTETIERIFGSPGEAANVGTLAPFSVLLVLMVAAGEEIFFRLGIQNFLANYLSWQGRRYWAAIAATSLLWTLGHAGVLDPDWVKLAQIYPIGLMLGWLFHRHGVEACILAHGLFNVVTLALSSFLLT